MKNSSLTNIYCCLPNSQVR